MAILIQFIFRMTFGLALGMAVTSPRQVTSGYYRNHLYVLLGLNVLASMVALSKSSEFLLAPPLAAAILSYVGSVIWLYEKPRAGIMALWIIAGLGLWGSWDALGRPLGVGSVAEVLNILDPLSSGLVLGVTMAAMLLGHWYLNTPTMALAPLQKLVWLMAGSIVLRMIVCGAGLVLSLMAASMSTDQLLFLLLRWLSGLLGALLLTIMTRKTLDIPNTQSATGILYVGVIVTFLGELVSLLLASGVTYPL